MSQSESTPDRGGEPPQFSLVIATLEDDGDLGLCLESLARLPALPSFEVIVIDQNPDDRLVPVVARFQEALRLRHERVVFRNACRARNLGVELARGRWVGFPDDDCQLLPDALVKAGHLASTPNVRVITGRTVDESGASNVLRWSSVARNFDRWNMFGCLTEATLFVERQLFLAAGGFDERFGPGGRFPAAEGIELMNRLFLRLQAGERACYHPDVRMVHPSKIPPWNRWAVERFYSYAQGDGALIAKSPQPHILLWGMRTVVSAALQTLVHAACLRGWQSMAFAARIVGLVKGATAYLVGSARRG